MLSARIKAIFVLLFATIAIMAVTIKNTPPVSEYMQTGIRLSDLPDLERTEFMVAKGATAVPYNYIALFSGCNQGLYHHFRAKPV